MKQNKINVQYQEKNFLKNDTDDIIKKYNQSTNKSPNNKETRNAIQNINTINHNEFSSINRNTNPANVSIAPKYSQNAEKLKALEDRMTSIEVNMLLLFYLECFV